MACRTRFPGGQSAEGRRIPGLSRIPKATGVRRWSITNCSVRAWRVGWRLAIVSDGKFRFMINFSDGTAEMSITELDHEGSVAKQSVMPPICRATRHGVCGYIRISQRANSMNLLEFQPMRTAAVVRSFGEACFPRGSTGARCARPAAWRPWHAVRGAVGRLWRVDYGENRTWNPFDHAALSLIDLSNHELRSRDCYWQSRIEPSLR